MRNFINSEVLLFLPCLLNEVWRSRVLLTDLERCVCVCVLNISSHFSHGFMLISVLSQMSSATAPKGWGPSPIPNITDMVLVVEGAKLNVNKVGTSCFFLREFSVSDFAGGSLERVQYDVLRRRQAGGGGAEGCRIRSCRDHAQGNQLFSQVLVKN